MRGEVPALKRNGSYEPAAERIANEAILAFVIRCAMACNANAISEVECLLSREFSGKFPGSCVFSPASGKCSNLPELSRTVCSIAHKLLTGDHLAPDAFWMAGLRLLEWTNQSKFGSALIPHLAAWQRMGWERIVESERFQLILPRRTVPEIQAVLDVGLSDQKFVAKLILASNSAVRYRLPETYRNLLVAVSTGEGHPSE